MIHVNAQGTYDTKMSNCGRPGVIIDAGVFVQEMGEGRRDLCPDCAAEILRFVQLFKSMLKPQEVRCVEKYFKKKIL